MFNLNKKLKTPLYIQVYKNIKESIENGSLKEGDKLPSIRGLSKKLDVNNITIVNAFKLLEKEGFVYSIKGSGTYVRPSNYNIDLEFVDNKNIELMPGGTMSIEKDTIDLSSLAPSHKLFPIEDFKQAMVQVLDRDKGLAFNYPEVNGYEPLRESISCFLKDQYKMDTDKDYIQIISGGQQGIDIISKTLLLPGDCVFVENPTYSGAVSTFKSRGAKVIGIPIKEDGIDLEILEEYIKIYNPKLVYTMPYYQSPTGYSYSEETKKKLIELSQENSFYIIEDDFLMDINFNKKNLPLKSYDKYGKVIYIKSFSKSFMPGIRIGFLTMTDELLPGIIRSKHNTDISSSAFLQRAFDLYMRKGYLVKYIKYINQIYQENYTAMLDSLQVLKKYDLEIYEACGGLSFWIRLPEKLDATVLYEACKENKLSISPGNIFFVDDSIYSNYIRLSFRDLDQSNILEGIKILETTIKDILA